MCALVLGVHAAEDFRGNFAEPADGGNLDVEKSRFEGDVAYLVPRWHESEALGSGSGARRWRNMLFAIRGVKGKIVTFRLPMQPAESGVSILNMDSASFALVSPVWSYSPKNRAWKEFSTLTQWKPDGEDSSGTSFPADSLVNTADAISVSRSSSRKEDYGWSFRNEKPFTEDVVYISINEHLPVGEFYDWVDDTLRSHAWVKPTASEVAAGTGIIGYQSGSVVTSEAFSRTVPDQPLYAFQIKETGKNPTKVVVLVSGQHPYEGQNKAVLKGAIEWILDPTDPAAAAYRATYVTLIYPLVNPVGEWAGLWRGTAVDVRRDMNRNWSTPYTNPASDRAIDTVIIHKQAMIRDLAALGLGEPHAVLDLHQNFGDRLPVLSYVLHDGSTAASSIVGAISSSTGLNSVKSDPGSNTQTLRGWWKNRGVKASLTIERSTYSTLAEEAAFGRKLMQAFAPEVSTPAQPTPNPESPVVEQPSTGTPVVEEPVVDVPNMEEPVLGAPVVGGTATVDEFNGVGDLAGRKPDTASASGDTWVLAQGSATAESGMLRTGNTYVRALVDAKSAEGVVEATVRLVSASSYAGLVLAATDAENFLAFRIRSSGWALTKISGSTGQTLASGTGNFSTGEAVALRAEISASSLVLKINGSVVHTCTLSRNAAATRFGLCSGTPYAFLCDRFAVAGESSTPSADPVPPPVVVPEPKPEAPVVVPALTDGFAGSGALAGRTAEGSTAKWSSSVGSMQVGGGVAYSGRDYARSWIDSGRADATVSAKVKLVDWDGYAGLALRAGDAGHLYFRIKSDGWAFGSIKGSTAKSLASGSLAIGLGVPHALRATLSGQWIVLSINGTQVYSGNVAEFVSQTAHGFTSGSKASFSADEFSVHP